MWVQREAGKVRKAAELELDLALEEPWEAAGLVSRPRGELAEDRGPGGRAKDPARRRTRHAAESATTLAATRQTLTCTVPAALTAT